MYIKRYASSVFACCLLFIQMCLVDAADVEFNRDVRPILTDKCFACHGPDAETVEGDLRLDLAEAAKADGSAIVAGRAAISELIRRIESDDADAVMPPPHTHKPVSPDELEVLRQWIDQGAVYQPHWAYTPLPKSVALDPSGSASGNQIDRFVAARLAAEGVRASPPADRITLIRRLSLDLTGIPPTPEEVSDFVGDTSPGALRRVVDRLLSSPRFGERMAVYWLDLVRYADTVGYHGDQNISHSPYRDYVIEAFNANMPYDQFVREQLAGDLLSNPTIGQLVASGYNRLNQTTEEGGSQDKEYLAIYFADRVRNVSQVFMGATMGCAQCHDHKYDPYTTRDFYSLGAFFADLEERGVYGARERPPQIAVLTDDQQARLVTLDQSIAVGELELATLRTEVLSTQTAWEEAARRTLASQMPVVTTWIDDREPAGANATGDWLAVSESDSPVRSGQSSRRQASGGLVQYLFTGATEPVVIGGETTFYAWVYLDEMDPPKSIMLQFNDGDWEHRAVWGDDSITYGHRDESYSGYRRAGELPAAGAWVQLEIAASELGLVLGDEVNGMAFTQFGGSVYWDDAGWIQLSEFPSPVSAALAVSAEQRDAVAANEVTDYFLAESKQLQPLTDRVTSLRNQKKTIESNAITMAISRSVEPRTIRVLHRGDWMDDTGEIVLPDVPEFLGPLELGDRRANRLDLANWLCKSDNPLTSRTMVNRLWSLMFGRGICASVDDLGGQGTYPSHPELLDQLSAEFIESGWDIKAMLRQIVMSDTYRRSSKASRVLQAEDPYNDLLARQGRFRVDAETVRDIALSVSGLLVENVGGVSVRPYQPEGYYGQLNFPRRVYQPDSGNDQYRRGVYTHWQRTFLHPMLKAFDAPSREECTAARARSNTPLQALTMLNDPTFIEASKAFAVRIQREGGQTNAERIRFAFQLAVSRLPEDAVAAELERVRASHLTHYRQHPDQAREFWGDFNSVEAREVEAVEVKVVELQNQPEVDGVVELSAWASVARVILNLHETITRY